MISILFKVPLTHCSCLRYGFRFFEGTYATVHCLVLILKPGKYGTCVALKKCENNYK